MNKETRDEQTFVQRLTKYGTHLLELDAEEDIKTLSDALWTAHDEYMCEQLNKRLTKPVKEQKKALKDLTKAIAKVENILHRLKPEYILRLELDSKKLDSAHQISFDMLKSQSATVVRLINAFLEDFSPPSGRPVDWALEHAVRKLLPAVETLSNGQAKIRWNKHIGGPPEPNSKAAKFMVHVIMQFQNAPTQTAILNMIAKVQDQPFPGKSTFDAVVEDKDDPYDTYGNPKSEAWNTNP